MQDIISSPVPMHVGRRFSTPPANRPTPAPARPVDPRWSLLDLVRRCRKHLGLSDRDLSVLRGLLSFVPQTADAAARVVFASNRVLIERCDGMDERTLRRRIAHLQARGLLARRSSPNGKRYQVRDDGAVARLTYGIDLSPLFDIRDHLEALADQAAREEIRCKAHRSMIRDILYHHGATIPGALADVAQRSLRRALTSEQLGDLIKELEAELPQSDSQSASAAVDLTVSDSQNDRHIQNSEREYFDSDRMAAAPRDEALNRASTREQTGAPDDISVAECMERARNAASFAPVPAQDWNDVIRLSDTLAPAVGIGRSDVDSARKTMGALGSALAILGIVESFDKIRRPKAYLHALTKRAAEGGLDFVRMFRSLTRGHVGAGCAA